MNKQSMLGMSTAYALSSLLGLSKQPKNKKRNKRKDKIAKASRKKNRK